MEKEELCNINNGTFYESNGYIEDTCKINNEVYSFIKLDNEFKLLKYGEVYNG